jgi:hypothetical protein
MSSSHFAPILPKSQKSIDSREEYAYNIFIFDFVLHSLAFFTK